RGALEAVQAVEQLEGVLLLLIGAGADHQAASEYVKQKQLENKVKVFPKLPYETLVNYTACSDLGLSLDKGLYFNYLYSLPNKLFDYVHAGIPVLTSNLPEVSKVVLGYKLGKCIDDVTPENIAKAIQEMKNSDLSTYQPAIAKAQAQFHWKKEAEVIRELMNS
ncbi:MAG: glycosyltransferase, partial [Flavobacteriales bacterium]